MKILALADIHLRGVKPQCRVDEEEWHETIKRKFEFIAKTAQEEQVDCIAIAGDIFDSWRNNAIQDLTFYWELFAKLNAISKVYTIPGNHDCMGGNLGELYKTPYALFSSGGMFLDNPFGFYPYTKTDYLDGDFEIVLAHKGLYLNEKPYPNAPDTGNVEWFVKNCLPSSCRLLIAGDYHKPFVTKIGDTTVVNCGSLFRLRADQMDYKPVIHICNITDTDVAVKKVPIPLEYPIRRDYIDDVNAQAEQMDELVGTVSGDFEVSLSFKDNFINLIAELPNKEKYLKVFESNLI